MKLITSMRYTFFVALQKLEIIGIRSDKFVGWFRSLSFESTPIKDI